MRKFIIAGLAALAFAFPALAQNPGVTIVPPFTAGHCTTIINGFQLGDSGAICGAGSGVSSFAGRTGAVVAQAGDYSAFYLQQSGAITAGHCASWAGTNQVQDAGGTCASLSPVQSVFARVGTVTAQLADYAAFYLQFAPSQNYYVNGNNAATSPCGPTGALTCSIGVDTNDCLTPATSCLTVNHVIIQYIGRHSYVGTSAQINLAHCSTDTTCGNYVTSCANGPWIGTSVVGLAGDGANLTAVQIRPGPSGAGVALKDGCTISIHEIAFRDNGTNNASSFISVSTGAPGHIDITNVDFGACAVCIAVNTNYSGMTVTFTSGVKVTGNEFGFLQIGNNSTMEVDTGAITGNASLTFSGAFAFISNGGTFIGGASAFSGFASVSGPKCQITDSFAASGTIDYNTIFPGSTLCNPISRIGTMVSTGIIPTNSGSCAINTQTGGASAGSFKANGACAGGTVIFGLPGGASYACDAADITTPADTMKQTFLGGGAVIFTGTMVTGDVVVWKCMGF